MWGAQGLRGCAGVALCCGHLADEWRGTRILKEPQLFGAPSECLWVVWTALLSFLRGAAFLTSVRWSGVGIGNTESHDGIFC